MSVFGPSLLRNQQTLTKAKQKQQDRHIRAVSLALGHELLDNMFHLVFEGIVECQFGCVEGTREKVDSPLWELNKRLPVQDLSLLTSEHDLLQDHLDNNRR